MADDRKGVPLHSTWGPSFVRIYSHIHPSCRSGCDGHLLRQKRRKMDEDDEEEEEELAVIWMKIVCFMSTHTSLLLTDRSMGKEMWLWSLRGYLLSLP